MLWRVLLLCAIVTAKRRGNMLNRALTRNFEDLSSSSSIAPSWFPQVLDHFASPPNPNATWMQKYYLNDTYYRPGGPIFLFIGGEGPLGDRAVTSYMMSQYAQEFGALQVALEHRFYGDSHPFPNLALPTMRYLSSKQALADLASFRNAINSKYGDSNTKWFTFGGSYPGSLSAWARLKYPHLFYGAIASSAPVRAKLDFFEYLQVVQNSLISLGSRQCVDNIAKAVQETITALQTVSGRETVEKLFKLCKPLRTPLDTINFWSEISDGWMGTVQYNLIRRGADVADISSLCKKMTTNEVSSDSRASPELTAFAAVQDIFLRQNGDSCLNASYEDMIESLRNPRYGDESAARSWVYQTCTEFGYYQTTDAPAGTQPFGGPEVQPLSFSLQICQDVFGVSADQNRAGIEETNTYYGSDKPEGSRILFVNGRIDPWHSLSVLNDYSGTQAHLIEGSAHCADMRLWQDGDPAGIKDAQERTLASLRSWLAM